MIDIKAIREAAEAATQGGWITSDNSHIYSAGLQLLAVAQHCRDKEANAKHIATANPATVLALCDEVERLQHANGNPLAMLGIDQLRDENKELRQEAERLRKDAARLDWLNENGGEAGLSQTPSGWRLQRGLDSTHHQTLHDAIDAAMETKCLNQ